MFYYSLVDLHLGQVGLVWIDEESPILVRVVLPEDNITTPSLLRQYFPESRPSAHTIIDNIASKLREYDQGKYVEFTLSDLMLHR